MTWNDFTPATCWPAACFCEAVRDGWIRQPSNTVSSFAFCLVAGWMVLDWSKRGRGAFLPIEAGCFVVGTFLVGATSALYHASLTFFGQTLDVQSMYLLVLAAVAINVDALRPKATRRFLWVYLGTNVVLGVLLVTVPVFRRVGFGLALAAVLVTEVWLRRRALRLSPLRPLVGAVLVQALAFGIWAMDLSHTWCAPESLVQGHAVWHALGAVASGLLWVFYRGERPLTASSG